VLCYSAAFGQNSRWGVGAVVALEQSEYFYTTYAHRGEECEPMLGYGFGLEVGYNLGERWTLKSGLTYFEQGFKLHIDYDYLRVGYPHIPIYTKHQYGHIRIPFLVGYNILKIGNFSIRPEVGGFVGFQVKYIPMTQWADDNQTWYPFETEGMNTTMWGLRAGLGLDYSINQHMGLGVTPYLFKDLVILDEKRMKEGQNTFGNALSGYYSL
jgi:hypothetical protein